MDDPNKLPKTMVVTGDVTIDWNLMSNPVSNEDETLKAYRNFTRICSQQGGVLILANLVKKMVAQLNQGAGPDAGKWIVRSISIPEEPIHPDDELFSHSCATWARFPAKAGSSDNTIWRVKEFLGIDRPPLKTASPDSWGMVADDDPNAAVVVLDDANLGFRDRKSGWPKALSNPQNRPWIILKMAKPVAQGLLWEDLHRNFADRLVVVIPVDDLRLTEVQISRELSWERTAQDVAWELVYNPKVNALSDCAHVIVTFKNAGAVLLSHTPANPAGEKSLSDCRLFFDPKVIEGSWEQSFKGGMVGYHTCLVAGIAREFLAEKPDLMRGITAGISAMRALHLKGYDEVACRESHTILAFPEDRILAELNKPGQSFSQARIQFPTRMLVAEDGAVENRPLESGMWTILQEQHTGNLEDVGRAIVLEGAESALQNVPLGQFSKLITVDRREIEGLRSIRTLINEYCSKEHPERPLSIAVFGPPGSGKSFGIKQVAKSLRPGEIEDMTFNLSQMKSPDELAGAFHQVRDRGLRNIIPLVFWDEFDSALAGSKLGWLRYFLAPMQDGEFLEGPLPHPLGRAIFVFAGGTSSSLEEFLGLKAKNEEAFKDSKAPDFVSRLRGYVNILGANPPKEGEKPDPYYLIRRAILLRSVLTQNVPAGMITRKNNKEILNIDTGVLQAFLKTREYKHGVRSMEALVNMSLLTGKSRFERSSLPSEAQLDLHVNGLEFLALVQSIVLEGEVLEKLAEASHDVYCEGMRAQNYIYGPTRSDEEGKKTHPLLVKYQDLLEYYKQSNRSSVWDIPNKLALIGYIMIPARSNEPPIDFPGDDLERLAEMEHDRYMLDAIAHGWYYEKGKKKEFPIDPTLLPWGAMTDEEAARRYPLAVTKAIGRTELASAEKEKDRKLVRDIPKILARVGYAVIKLSK